MRRELKHPGQDKRDRQTNDDEQDNRADSPIRNIEHWKNLCDSLRKRQTGDEISHRNFVNVTPLQFAEECLRVHLSIFSTIGTTARQVQS